MIVSATMDRVKMNVSGIFQDRIKPVTNAVERAWARLAQWGPVQELLQQYQSQEPLSSSAPDSMSSSRNNRMANVTTIDLLTLATSLPYGAQISIFSTGIENVTFQSFNDSFSSILGSNASWRMIANETWQAFHEAGVYHQDTKSLYISSNWAGDFANPINISVLSLEDYSVTSQRYEGLASPNGGTTYVTPGTDETPQILLCDEGDLEGASGLSVIDPVAKKAKVQFVHSKIGTKY
jgi:hypothetical protein